MNTNITEIDFIGKRIALARESFGISRFELADKMCLSRSMAGKWERGLSNPSVAHLVKLSKILSVSFEWLATGVSDSTNNTYNPDLAIDDETHLHNIQVVKVNKIMAKMTLKQKQSWVGFLAEISV